MRTASQLDFPVEEYQRRLARARSVMAEAVFQIARDVRGRRHIIGQGDATILPGTPEENI